MAGLRGQALPTGTITFLFTDVEGSTRLIRSHADAFPHLLERHRAILRAAFDEHGVEFGSEGDALFYAFARADEAVAAAVGGQQGLSREKWPADVALLVRMGLNTGPAEQVGDNYVGLELHRVARIMAAAHGGQVLASSSTATLCASGVADAQLSDLGRFKLKDFDEPEHLWQVSAPGLRLDFPPPRTRQGRTVALPREASPLLGRDQDLARLQELALAHRLLTLTGPGGTGKTRLATSLGWSLAPRIPDDVALVELAPISSVDLVPGAIATAVAGRGFEAATLDELCEHIGSGYTLLILDNTEHLEGVGEIAVRVLEECPETRIVATSRRPLGVRGEQQYPVGPLAEDAAVALINERITSRRPDHRPSVGEADMLRRIAVRLDGLPLALELAAARLRLLSPKGLLERLDRQLDFLRDDRADLPPRQRTMRATIEWSWRLLPRGDVQVLCAVASFVAPATLASIAYVCNLDEVDAIGALERLSDASLVRVVDSSEARLGMLEPIRQFALERLAEDRGAARDFDDRLLLWYESSLVDRTMRPTEASRVLADADNFCEALRRCFERGDYERWVRVVYPVAHVLGRVDVNERIVGWMGRIDPAQLSPDGKARLASIRATTTGWLDAALWMDVVRLAEDAGHLVAEKHAWQSIANSCIATNRSDDAAAALAKAQAIHPPTTALDAFDATLAAAIADYRGEAEADALWDRAESAVRAAADVGSLMMFLTTRAYATLGRGEYREAQSFMTEAVSLASATAVDPAMEFVLSFKSAITSLVVGDIGAAENGMLDALVLDDQIAAVNRTIPTALMLYASAAVLAAADRGPAALTARVVGERRLYEHFDISDERVIAQLRPFLDSAAAGLSPEQCAAAIAAAETLDESDAVRLAIDEIGIALRSTAVAAEAGRT